MDPLNNNFPCQNSIILAATCQKKLGKFSECTSLFLTASRPKFRNFADGKLLFSGFLDINPASFSKKGEGLTSHFLSIK